MPYRLGDVIDDYCSRCRMISNNAIEAMVGETVAKVRCRTCNFSHDYKHGRMPEKAKPRKTSQKAAFDAVLASVMEGQNVEFAERAAPQPAKKPARPRREVAHHGLRTLSAARKKLESS